MAKDSKRVEFKTYEEYLEYYSTHITQAGDIKASKYYQIGESIARMASEEVISRTIYGRRNSIA